MAKIIDLRKRGYSGKRPFRVDYADIFKNRKRIHFKTKKEAEKFLTTIEAEKLKVKEGLLPDWFFNGNANDPTVQEVFDQYVERKVALKDKDSAQRAAVRNLNGFVTRFGKLKVSQLNPGLINEYQAERVRSGKAKSTLSMNFQTFKTMLGWAVKDGLIVTNPLQGTETEKGKSKEKQALTEDEIRQFIIGLRDHPAYLQYFVLM